MSDNVQWVKVFATTDPIEAGIVKTMLNEHGIPTIEMNKQDSVYVVIGELELLVPTGHADEAHLLILSLKFGGD